MSRAKLDLIRQACPAVLPSLLQCDFGDLRGECARLEAAGTRVLHLDVMDGHFVPNMTYAMPIVEGLNRHTELPLDVHLMISDPLKYAGPMVDAGADILTFHVEAVDDPVAVAKQLRGLGVIVGAAVNPDTPVESIFACLDEIDMALVMSVNAGFGGQSFNPNSLSKLRALRERSSDLLLQIDGGINPSTIGGAASSGCDLFVVGSAIFGQEDYGAAIRTLDAAIQSAG